MSSQRGNVARSRPQKHQNRNVWKNDLHDKSAKKKLLNQMEITHVCPHCVEIVKWKIKYDQYKPLSVPKSCVKCHQKTVKRGYMVICETCTEKLKVCAKCLKESPGGVGENERPGISGADVLIFVKSLPERKRRTFFRFLRKTTPGVDVDDISPSKKFGPDVKEMVEKMQATQEKDEDDEDGLDDLDF